MNKIFRHGNSSVNVVQLHCSSYCPSACFAFQASSLRRSFNETQISIWLVTMAGGHISKRMCNCFQHCRHWLLPLLILVNEENVFGPSEVLYIFQTKIHSYLSMVLLIGKTRNEMFCFATHACFILQQYRFNITRQHAKGNYGKLVPRAV